MEGFFKAPQTGKYRFYITCDDVCKLEFDAANPYDEASPPTYSHVNICNSGYTNYRDHTRSGGKKISDWIDLVGGKKYSMIGKHYEGTS